MRYVLIYVSQDAGNALITVRPGQFQVEVLNRRNADPIHMAKQQEALIQLIATDAERFAQ